MNGDWIDDGNEYPVIMQFPGNRFVVSSCCLHDNARIFTECEDLIRQTLQTDCIVHDIDGCLDYLTHRAENCHRAPALGNIDTDCVHLLYLLMLKFMATAFTHCLFNLLRYDTNAPKRWLNLLKSNAANERGG